MKKILTTKEIRNSNETFNNPKLHGGGSYQTSPENFYNSEILEEGNYQTSPSNLYNSKFLEGEITKPLLKRIILEFRRKFPNLVKNI